MYTGAQVSIKTKNLYGFILSAILLLMGCRSNSATAAVPGNKPIDTPTPIVVESTDDISPIAIQLILSKLPSLGEQVSIRMIVTANENLPNAVISLILPEEVDVLSGDVSWEGELQIGSPVILNYIVMFNEPGSWIIKGQAIHDLGGGNAWGASAVLYLHVTETERYLGFPTSTPFVRPAQ